MIAAEWITVKEAAAELGISAAYFRDIYCSKESPKVVLRVRTGPKGQRRILVLKASVMALIEQETRMPA